MNTKNNGRVPKLRFKEFSSEWEEKKLGEISSKVNKKNKDNLIKKMSSLTLLNLVL